MVNPRKPASPRRALNSSSQLESHASTEGVQPNSTRSATRKSRTEGAQVSQFGFVGAQCGEVVGHDPHRYPVMRAMMATFRRHPPPGRLRSPSCGRPGPPCPRTGSAHRPRRAAGSSPGSTQSAAAVAGAVDGRGGHEFQPGAADPAMHDADQVVDERVGPLRQQIRPVLRRERVGGHQLDQRGLRRAHEGCPGRAERDRRGRR